MDSLIGQMLGRYQIIEQLGEGGMATVYKGFDTTLHRNVAIKVIKAEMTGDINFRKRFEREARALAQLSHPHIVHINDYGDQGGMAFLVMDYLSGGTLKQKMGRPMPYQEAARLIIPIAQALGYAHQHKIIHRDVKPANVLMNESGIPMLTDFGIAKMFEATSETLDLTSSGMGVGTPAYMAPEQAGGHFDHRADIYSLGIVFYELVTGRRPYDADTPLATLMKHATDPLPPPRNFVPSLPDAVEQVIYKALAKNPNDRFQNMEEFAHQLEMLQFGNLQTTFARIAPPEPATMLAPQGPIVPPSSQYGSYGTGQTSYAPISSQVPPPPVINLAPQSNPAYQQPPPPIAAPLPAYAPPKKSSSKKWFLSILAIGAVLVILAVVGAGAYLFWPLEPTADLSMDTATANALNAQITSMAVKAGTVTAQVKATQFVSSEVTRQVNEQASTATQGVAVSTQQANNLAVQKTATQTTIFQDAQALLQSPRVAFLNKNDIWVVGLDGANPIQLTQSGGDKRSPNWFQDGKSIYYLSGKCLQSVNFLTKTESKIICFNFAQKVTGFEISADGKYAGVLVDNNLYVGKYDPAQLKKLTTQTAMSEFATCGYYSGTRYFHFSADSSKVAVAAIAPGEDVIRIQNQACVSHNTVKLDEFPGDRFRPFKFNNSPLIYSFGWDGGHTFALATNFRATALGYHYFYNSESKVGTQTNILGNDCCYYSPQFSADGSYIVFGYQDLTQPDTTPMSIYAVSVGDIGTGKKFTPITLPATFFSGGAKAAPQPVIYLPTP